MRIEAVFGGRTRFATIEALADAKQPITAHQIAIIKGLDPAATYRCLTELEDFGIVESKERKRNQTVYNLSDGPGQAAARFLQSLKQKTHQPEDLEEWTSPGMQSARMEKTVRVDRAVLGNPQRQDIDKIMSRRAPGELSALIASSKIAFSELFEKNGDMFILKI